MRAARSAAIENPRHFDVAARRYFGRDGACDP
jgi:hypothetical protein